MRRLGMSVASVTFSSRQAAIWRHWPTRQHRRDRAVHPHDENALHARHSRPCATRDAARGTQSICQLVQRPPSAHDAQRGHSGRDLPRPTSDLSLPAIRAATELASEVTVRSARCPDPRPVWPAVRTERRVRNRPKAPAEGHAASRGVGHASPQRLSRWRAAPTDRSASLCYRIVNEQPPAALAAVRLPF